MWTCEFICGLDGTKQGGWDKHTKKTKKHDDMLSCCATKNINILNKEVSSFKDEISPVVCGGVARVLEICPVHVGRVSTSGSD